jgi:hypothetical protein
VEKEKKVGRGELNMVLRGGDDGVFSDAFCWEEHGGLEDECIASL